MYFLFHVKSGRHLKWEPGGQTKFLVRLKCNPAVIQVLQVIYININMCTLCRERLKVLLSFDR